MLQVNHNIRMYSITMDSFWDLLDLCFKDELWALDDNNTNQEKNAPYPISNDAGKYLTSADNRYNIIIIFNFLNNLEQNLTKKTTILSSWIS